MNGCEKVSQDAIVMEILCEFTFIAIFVLKWKKSNFTNECFYELVYSKKWDEKNFTIENFHFIDMWHNQCVFTFYFNRSSYIGQFYPLMLYWINK